MEDNTTPTTSRSVLHALVFEKDGDMNLSQLFCLIMGVCAVAGFIVTVVLGGVYGMETTVWDRVAAWSFMGAAFASVLIASIPIAKSKILANSKLPGEIAKGISSVASEVTTSTDISELSDNGTKTIQSEIG